MFFFHISQISLCFYVLYACRSEDSLAAAQQVCQEMSENLRRITQDKQSFDLRTAAELDDLYRTKINLEERLVELIRYKHIYLCQGDYVLTHIGLSFSLFVCLLAS